MTAEQLLANMLDVYALAGTYRDVGQLLKYFRHVGHDGETRPSSVEFRTAYSRPDRLRFEERHFHTSGECFAHKITCADGGDARRWRDSAGALPPTTSLSGAFSIVALTVHPVLALLTSGQVEGWLTNLTGATLLTDEDLDGDECHRVRCRCSWWNQELTPEEQVAVDEGLEFLERVLGKRLPPEGRTVYLPLTLWIDCSTLLLRRIESGTITDRFQDEAVVTCQPEVGVALDPGELIFDPPK